MRPYETLVVLSNSFASEQQPLITRLEDLIKSLNGTLDGTRDWGSKRLAYQIRKQSDAHFYLIEYQADGDVVAELERTLRISEGVLRFATVQQEHTGLPEVRQREMPRRDAPLSEMRGDRPSPPHAGAADAAPAVVTEAAAAPAADEAKDDAAPAAETAGPDSDGTDQAEEKTNE